MGALKSAQEKLDLFYKQFTGNNNVLIVINADPDAIASAMAVKRLLWRKTASVEISNINIIKRPDNLTMIRLLEAGLVHIDEIDKTKFDRFVMVDSQPNHNELLSQINPDVIIDHHPETNATASYMDIRPKYGATASIMTEYLKAAKIKPSSKLATGLVYAIKTDTNNFERKALIEDVRAFQFLFKHANIHLVRKIEQSELCFDCLKYFKIAIQDMCVRQNRVFAYIGNVINPDICVLAADFFMKVSCVRWSVVSGIYAEKLVIILRNDGLCKNAGNVAQRSFGNIGSAGGHKSMARAEIPIASVKNLITNNKRLSAWIIENVEKNTKTNHSRKNNAINCQHNH